MKQLVRPGSVLRAVAAEGGWHVRLDGPEGPVWLSAQRGGLRLLRTERGLLSVAREVGAGQLLVDLSMTPLRDSTSARSSSGTTGGSRR